MWYKATTVNDDGIIINTEQIAMILPKTREVILAGRTFILPEKTFDDLLKTLFPKRKTYSKDDTELATFLNELHTLTGGKNEAILTPQRNKKLTELLKSFTKEQLVVAATNIGKDEWLQGKNDNHKRYGDIDYLLRPDKAAKFAELNPEDKKRKLF